MNDHLATFMNIRKEWEYNEPVQKTYEGNCVSQDTENRTTTVRRIKQVFVSAIQLILK